MPMQPSRLDTLLEETVGRGALPHALGMVLHRGEVVYRGHAGDTDTSRVYRIASMTKPITSVAAMQLIERGQLALDDPYTDYLDVPEPRVLDRLEADGTAHFHPAQRAATIRELLTHTNGFAMAVWNASLYRYFASQGHSGHGPGGAGRLQSPMVCEPGTEWHYSIGTDILGQIVEAISGVDLEAWCQTHIFAPLGMTDTTFTLPDSDAERLVRPYRRRSSGDIIPLELPYPRANGYCSGGGGLVSTANDYALFLSALSNGGEGANGRILDPDTIATMGENHTGSILIPSMRTNDPALSADVDLFPGISTCWGLGFLINTGDVPARRRAGSRTWAGLYNTHFWHDPASEIAGLLMTQMLPFCDPALIGLYEAFETAVYAEYG